MLTDIRFTTFQNQLIITLKQRPPYIIFIIYLLGAVPH